MYIGEFHIISRHQKITLIMLVANQWLEKGASSWFRAEKVKVWDGQRSDWLTWEMFTQEIIATFSPIMEEE